jgi:hypothetical protein
MKFLNALKVTKINFSSFPSLFKINPKKLKSPIFSKWKFVMLHKNFRPTMIILLNEFDGSFQATVNPQPCKAHIFDCMAKEFGILPANFKPFLVPTVTVVETNL